MRNIFLQIFICVFSFAVLTGCQTREKDSANTDPVNEQTSNDESVIKVRHYKSGAVETETEYVNNVRHGFHKMYDEEGHLISESRFENNLMVGELKTYYPDGTLKVIANYSAGKPNGELISFYPDGKIWKKQIYEDGSLKSSKEYNTDGKLEYEDTF